MNSTRRYFIAVVAGIAAALIYSLSFAFPSVYLTGTTIYQPDKTWNGFTVFGIPDQQGAVLIDMNATEVRRWAEIKSGGPARILPGGYVVG